jgi:sec-independent protein translocase protein TatA
MELLGPWHLIIVAGIFVMMFGAKRLPDAARSLGKSARILKTELKDMHDDPRPAPSVAVPADTVSADFAPVIAAPVARQPVVAAEPVPETGAVHQTH